MPRLLIHKEGENPTIESPELTAEALEEQGTRVAAAISIRHREGGVEQGRDETVDLGWCVIAAHVITGVEVVDGESEEAA